VFIFNRPASRRSALLSLGGAALLSACGKPATTAWHDPDPAVSGLPPVARPAPGVCPPGKGEAQHAGGPQFYLPCDGTQIALTIDDGPDPKNTPRVLAVLAKYQVPATFCMIGRSAAAHPDLVKQVIAGGHQVANHTYTHPLTLAKQTEAQVRAEIGRAGEAIETASGGHRPAFFRAPGGIWSPAVLAECRAQGVHPLDWSVDPRDWSQPGVRHIVTTILSKTQPGAIILEHDGGGNRDQTVDALGIVLPRLLHAGYKIVPIVPPKRS
jgi:peptidoglycan/xylan/chitin deacetylase (PgdA/CDA1 family)